MNSHLPVGRLADHLEALSREKTWFAIVVTTGAIAGLDHALPAVGFAPLYMLAICGAAWGLGSREAYLVAIVAAILAVLSSLHAGPPVEPQILALRATIRLGTFLFLAAKITSFRRSYDREQFHAHRDRMTGTRNKEVFQLRCARAIKNAAQTGQTLLLVILDLDDFKAVNSEEGHQAGDEVLRTFAKGMSSVMRREDLIGRIGGDEFSLLVRVPSTEKGQGFVYDIHARLTAVLAGARYPVTCSMGAVLIPSDAPCNADELMHLADQAMYRAKRKGKNAVEVTRAGEPPALRPVFAPARLSRT